MPFNRPFKEFYTPGDLLYGLSDTREKYAHTNPVFNEVNERWDEACSIDEYAINEGERELLKAKSISTPRNLPQFIGVLKAHPKYKSAYRKEGFWIYDNGNRMMIQDPFESARKCKAGLYWAANEQKFHVHFFLDGIDFEAVVTKPNIYDKNYPSVKEFLDSRVAKTTRYGHYSDRVVKDKSITNSELRWIYRNRNDRRVQKTIQFWNKGEPCTPPWEWSFDIQYHCRVSNLWLKYAPKNAGEFSKQYAQRPVYFCLASLFDCS